MSAVSVSNGVTRVQRFEAFDPEKPELAHIPNMLPSSFPMPTSAMHGLALLTTVQSSGAHRIILSRLLEMPFTDEPVLQLVHAVVTHRCSRAEECLLGLRRLLCRVASQSVHLGVKLLWTIEALANSADKTRAALEGLRELVEAAAVNGSEGAHAALLASSPTLQARQAAGASATSMTSSSSSSYSALSPVKHGSSFSSAAISASAAAGGGSGGIGGDYHHQNNNSGNNSGQNSLHNSFSSDNAADVEDLVIQLKMGRSALLTDQRLFFQQLVGISDFLRLIPDRSTRPLQLRMQLLQLSSSVLQRRVFMPFGNSSERPRWIVRILPDEAIVFSSRERAPYLLVVETVVSPPLTSATSASSSSAASIMAASAPAAAAAAAALSNRTCADPDVREAEALHNIGAGTTSGYHQYPKPYDGSVHVATPATIAAAAAANNKSGGGGGGAPAQKLGPDPFRESMAAKTERVRSASPFSHLPGWRVENIIIKAGDDLTQEQLALEVAQMLHNIWQSAGVPVFVLPYRALSCMFDGGIMECVNDANSIDSLKKTANVQTLHQFFLKYYGEGTAAHAHAQRNFIESMAGYSVMCFLMQVKDRHNANLMLTRSGHLVHIDFGFMFGKAPGGIQFESAPFKLSQELLDTMGGANSDGFRYFKMLLHLALSAVRDNADQLIQIIDVMARRSGMKCFGAGTEASAKLVIDELRERLALRLTDEVAVCRYIRSLVDDSLCNWRTARYDSFQNWQNGYV